MKKLTLTKKYLRTSFGTITYLETGLANNPPVLLVHVIPTSSNLWRHVLEIFKNDFHCYSPDLMGLGDTNDDPDSNNFQMDAQAEMLLEFMTSLGHERFSVIFHVQGGAAVQIIAARNPQKIKCQVIMDCINYDKLKTMIDKIISHYPAFQDHFRREKILKNGLLPRNSKSIKGDIYE